MEGTLLVSLSGAPDTLPPKVRSPFLKGRGSGWGSSGLQGYRLKFSAYSKSLLAITLDEVMLSDLPNRQDRVIHERKK